MRTRKLPTGIKNRTALDLFFVQRSKVFFFFKSTTKYVFLRATQSSIARGCECELKAAPRGPLGNMTRFHILFEEGEQRQACTNGLLLLPGLVFRSFARRSECRAEPPG